MDTLDRITVTIPSRLVAEIDRSERNRSRFVQEAVEHELAERRRSRLFGSLESPHPESESLENEDIADWIGDADPADSSLLDPAAGIPVRWIPEEGWSRS